MCLHVMVLNLRDNFLTFYWKTEVVACLKGTIPTFPWRVLEKPQNALLGQLVPRPRLKALTLKYEAGLLTSIPQCLVRIDV